MPGRHAKDTVPKGGDFVVMITDPAFKLKEHQFSHDDIFKDVELRHADSNEATSGFMKNYLEIVAYEEDVENCVFWPTPAGCIDTMTFFAAAQALAVAEHRRYARYEKQFGGRYLPFRAAAGIAEGLWDASLASERTRKGGRPGIEWLEQEFGTPALTKELMT